MRKDLKKTTKGIGKRKEGKKISIKTITAYKKYASFLLGELFEL